MENMLESLISQAIYNFLSVYESMGKLVFQRNNSFAGSITRKNGSVGYIKNSKAGAPDLYVFLPGGRTLHLEIKNERGRQSDSQKDFEKKLCSLGHTYAIVRSVEDVEQLIKEELENGRAKRPDEADKKPVK